MYKITNITTTGTHTFYSADYSASGPDPLASLWKVSGGTWTHLSKNDSSGSSSLGIDHFKITWNIDDLSAEYYLCVRNYNSANGTEGDVYVYATGPAAVTNYTITYYPGSYGSGSSFTRSSSGTTFTTEDNGYFSRTNHIQTGWSINSNGSTKDYELETTYSISSNLALYPYWVQINQYILNVGSYVDIAIPTATTHGYPSEDWDTVLSNGGFAFIIIDGVDSSGTYKFYSNSNSGDPCAHLLNEDAECIAQDD